MGAIAKPAKCAAHAVQRGDGGKLSFNEDIEKVLMPVGMEGVTARVEVMVAEQGGGEG